MNKLRIIGAAAAALAALLLAAQPAAASPAQPETTISNGTNWD